MPDNRPPPNTVESAIIRQASTWLTPGLLAVIGIVATQYMSEIRAAQHEQGEQLAQVGKQVTQVDGKVALLNAKVDYSIVQSLEDLKRRITLLEDQGHVLNAQEQHR